MYTIRVYYNPTCTVCQSAEKSCKCHYFQPVFKQRNISFICGLHYSAFEYPRRQKKSANGTLVWRRERDSNPCEIALKRFSRPPRYDHFDIPPYKRNYEIVLEKTLEEKTLLSEKCACLPQIQGFFADCFRYGKEVSRPPRYDRFDTSPYMKLSFDRNHQIFNCFRISFRNALLCCLRSAEKVRCYKAFQGFCVRTDRKFSSSFCPGYSTFQQQKTSES